jgi:hypothetical protein
VSTGTAGGATSPAEGGVTDGTGTGATPGTTGGLFGTEEQVSRSSEDSPSPMDDDS